MAALKGAFIDLGAGLLGALPNIIVFQFNPEQISRSPKMTRFPPASDGSGPTNADDQPGQPNETMSFSLNVDAIDQLAQSNPIAAANGILPALSALELLMIPRSSLSQNLSSLAGRLGVHKHPPDRLSTVLFFWGPSRLLPVNITSLYITETQYDTRLNPIRAEVSVSLTVLTEGQLTKEAAIARGAYQYSQAVKEVMAALNLANAAQLGMGAALSFKL